MYTKPCLSHADVATLLSAARAEAERNQWAVSIAVDRKSTRLNSSH